MKLFRTLTEIPWEAHGNEALAAEAYPGLASRPPEKTALRFFLGVVAILFSLFTVAYFMRMKLADWQAMPESPLLWLNTFLLFLSSVALQWTQAVLKRGETVRVKAGLVLGGLLTAAFIAGQLTVWQQMNGDGYFLSSNPANSFFYVLTGLHALHVLGGLWVWLRASYRVWSGAPVLQIQLSVELCTVYWHFLFLVWLVLFALLSYT